MKNLSEVLGMLVVDTDICVTWLRFVDNPYMYLAP